MWWRRNDYLKPPLDYEKSDRKSIQVILDKTMDQAVGYGSGLRRCGAIVPIEPPSFDQLLFLDIDFATFIFGCEGQHQLVGERPTLTTSIMDVLDGNPRLLQNLSTDGMFCCLTSFHEASDAGIDVLVALQVASQ